MLASVVFAYLHVTCISLQYCDFGELVNSTNGLVDMGPNCKLAELSKNWIPFEYRNRLLYIDTMNPLKIRELKFDRHTASPRTRTDSDSSVIPAPGDVETLRDECPHNLTTVYEETTEQVIPWPAHYGAFLRGGKCVKTETCCNFPIYMSDWY